MNALPTPAEASRILLNHRGRVVPADLDRLGGTEHPGLYAWFVDLDGAEHLAEGIGLIVNEGLIYAGQAGAGTSHATLGSRIRGKHLGGDIYGSTFRLTLASVLLGRLALEPIGGGHMSKDGEGRLTDWMRAHLAVSVVAYPDPDGLDSFETLVLDRLDPPLNIAKRPATAVRSELKILRRVFSRRATSETTTGRRPPRTAPSLQGKSAGLTPEELAHELGLPDAKRIRGFLRDRFPRPAAELWSRWGPLTPDMERAVRDRFGGAP